MADLHLNDKNGRTGMAKQTRRIRRALMQSAGVLAIGVMSGPVSAAEATSANQIEEIVITAQKRETLLEKTPVTISAVSGDALVRRGSANIADLTATVPNLSFSSN